MFCSNCGREVTAKMSYCPSCGHAVYRDREQPSASAPSTSRQPRGARSSIQQTSQPTTKPTNQPSAKPLGSMLSESEIKQREEQRKKKKRKVFRLVVIIILIPIIFCSIPINRGAGYRISKLVNWYNGEDSFI